MSALELFYENLKGTLNDAFGFGVSGPQIKAVGNDLEVRTNDDSALANLSVASPIDPDHAVNKAYVDASERPIIITGQVDGDTVPTNTAVAKYIVVNSTGTEANIGDVWCDDGSNTGDMTLLPAKEGRTIAVTDALTGGTVTFDPDSIYIWDEDNTQWKKIGDIGNTVGAIRSIRYAITNAAQQDSVSDLPGADRVYEATLIVTTAYPPGTTIQIGIDTDPDAFQPTTRNNPLVACGYRNMIDCPVGGTDKKVRTTIGGSPASGAGVVIVNHTSPRA